MIDWDVMAAESGMPEFAEEPTSPAPRARRYVRQPRREVDERRESVNDTTAEKAGRR